MKRNHFHEFKYIILIAVILIVTFVNTAFSQTSYTITDLGSLGGNYNFGYALNDSSEVVGKSNNNAFMWNNVGGILDIGTLGYSSEAADINNSSVVAGHFAMSNSLGHAFLYDKVNGMQDLGTFGHGASFAYGINNSGQVAGYTRNEWFEPCPPGMICTLATTVEYNAFTWDNTNGAHFIGTLGGNDSQAYSINDSGRVVGSADLSSGSEHAFIWDVANGMQDLGSLGIDGNTYSRAKDINNASQVTGQSDGHAFFWESGQIMQDLGTLGGIYSDALAINDIGQVVGDSATTGGNYHAFIWDSINGIQDLNDLLAPGSGWTLSTAEDINSNGEITGYGWYNGQRRAYLMTTTVAPEPISYVLFSVGAITLWVRKKFTIRK